MAEKKFHPFKYSEDEEINTTLAQLNDAPPFPPIPLAIISGMKKMPLVPESANAIHQDYQEKLMELSPNSKRYKCELSSHFPQITEPDAVIKALKELKSFTCSNVD